MTRLQASCAAILLILTLGLFVTRQHAETAQTPAGAGGQQIAESPDLTADLPIDARAALKQYLDKASAALDPLQKKCLDQLQALQKKYVGAGNNQAARAIQAEIEKLNVNLATISPFRILEGNWTVKYSNGATRTYTFRSNGSVYFHEERKPGRLVRARNGEIILDFNDNTAERLTLKAELQVDHFNPTNTWRVGGKPTFTGTGERGK